MALDTYTLYPYFLFLHPFNIVIAWFLVKSLFNVYLTTLLVLIIAELFSSYIIVLSRINSCIILKIYLTFYVTTAYSFQTVQSKCKI